MKNIKYIIAALMLLLFQFVISYALLTKISYQDQVISNLNSKITAIDNTLVTKADKSKIEAILKRTDGIAENIKVVNERINGWQGIWDNFFEPHQKQYMKRKQANE